MLSLLLTLIIVGVILYLVEAYIPMSPPIKTVIRGRGGGAARDLVAAGLWYR